MDNMIWYIVLALFITQAHYVLKFLMKFINVGKIGFYTLKITYKIGIVFSLINVLYHEIGHAVVAVMTRGEFYKITLKGDSTGVAYTGSRSRISKILTSAAGYPFASLVSLLFVYLVSSGHYYAIIYILVGTLLGSIIFLVRNWFGFGWCVLFLTIVLLVDTFGNQEQILAFVLFITAVLVVNSLTTALYILYASIYDTDNSGDALTLKESTKLPATFFGMFFAAQSLLITYFNITLF